MGLIVISFSGALIATASAAVHPVMINVGRLLVHSFLGPVLVFVGSD